MLSDTSIFSFHNVSDKINLGFNNISVNKFSRLIHYINKEKKTHKLEICFDDGYEEIIINALPILNSCNIKTTVFPITHYMGKSNSWDVNFIINKKKHLNVDQLKELIEHSWKIGSHGHNHISYKNLDHESIYKDLKESKVILEDHLNVEIDTFTPPFGYFDFSFIPIINKVGYKNIFLNTNYINTIQLDQTLNIFRRLPIYSIDTESSIKRKLKHDFFQEKFDYIVHSCSKATSFVKKIY